jgi:diguanylate cyclase (GGDEF)-like protein/PAS domain S-box-containing protein
MDHAGLTPRQWRELFDGHPAIMLLLDPTDGAVVAANHAAEAFYGYDADTFATLNLADLSPSSTPRPATGAADQRPGPSLEVVRHRLSDGRIREVEVASATIPVGERELLSAVVHDATEQQRVLAALAASEALAHRRALQLGDELAASHRRFETLVEHANDPIVVLDASAQVAYVSPAAAGFLGVDEISAADLVARVTAQDRDQLRAAWHGLLSGPPTTRRLVVEVTRADGRRRHLALTLSDLRSLEEVNGIVVTARDLSDELAVRARLEHQTTHDGLTGLANRGLLIDELHTFITSSDERPRPGALILLDLIGMAGINDRVGHRTGDYLLRAVGRRLSEAVGDRGIVARTSGDEFGVLIASSGGEAAALAMAHELARLFDEPFATPGGGTVLLRARFGAASTTSGSGAPGAVLRDANLALSATQASRTARIRVCDDALRHDEERRLRLEYELSTPNITEQFRLAFQPVVDLTTGHVPGLEALLLWDHPELGTISPAEFVPLAEHNGAIVQIGAWVLRRACEQLAAWDEEGIDPHLQLAVNVSARQLLDVELVPALATTLADTGLAPERIALEITETAIADDSEVTTATVQAIAELGARIHIDDFGTGYSSFAQLGRFPFHGLKIDRSFITPLGVEHDAEPIVAALLAIAGAQGLEVIAEGVDAELQASCLRGLGCRFAQGYLWSQPLPPAAVPAFLARHRRTPGAGAAATAPVVTDPPHAEDPS